MKRATRLENLPVYPFARWAQRVADVRQRGLDIIRLDMGNPDLPPPADIVEALCRSAQNDDRHGYAGYRGLPALREAMAGYYLRRFGVTLDPTAEVLPLIGSKEGIINLALACLDPGDVVLVPDPGYAPYTMGAKLAGAEIYTFPLLAANGFLPDFDAIPHDVLERAVLMWLNYPNNPTGAIADLKLFEQAVDLARRYGLLLCHDAPYSDVTYNGYLAPSILEVPGASDVAVEFNSLSKTWNMAGWRIGMAVGNAQALGALVHVKSNVDTGIFLPLQEAAVQALSIEPAWIAERNALYQERMDIVCNGLRAVGMGLARPRATLYAWAQVPSSWNSEQFALELLQRTGVALAPGSFFGQGGEGYIRISVTAPTERIREAMARVREFLAVR